MKVQYQIPQLKIGLRSFKQMIQMFIFTHFLTNKRLSSINNLRIFSRLIQSFLKSFSFLLDLQQKLIINLSSYFNLFILLKKLFTTLNFILNSCFFLLHLLYQPLILSIQILALLLKVSANKLRPMEKLTIFRQMFSRDKQLGVIQLLIY